MNDKLAEQKGLIGDKYIKIQNIYKYLFEKYILEKTDMKKYDLLIKESNLDFGIPHPTEMELTNNLNNNLNLNYIYLINRFFVEKLSIEEIDILKKYSNNELKDNKQVYSIIENTYKEIIKDNYLDNEYKDEIYKVCYGLATPNNFVNNNSLVLKIFYSKNNNKYTDEEYINNLEKKKEFLNNLTRNIINDVKNILNIDCSIIIEKVLY